LTVLKLADLVRVERRGQFQVYSLNTTVFQDLMTEVLHWFGTMEASEGEAASIVEPEKPLDVSTEDASYESL
jgi:hypothetical protein